MTAKEAASALIAACEQSAEAYHRATELLPGFPGLAHFCEEQEQTRRIAATSFGKEVRQKGSRPNLDEILAPAAEGWTLPASNDAGPRPIIEACHRADERASQVFEKALPAVPSEWRWEVEQHYQNVRSALAKIHAWLNGKEADPDII